MGRESEIAAGQELLFTRPYSLEQFSDNRKIKRNAQRLPKSFLPHTCTATLGKLVSINKATPTNSHPESMQNPQIMRYNSIQSHMMHDAFPGFLRLIFNYIYTFLVCTICMPAGILQKPKEGSGSPGTGIAHGCKLPCRC